VACRLLDDGVAGRRIGSAVAATRRLLDEGVVVRRIGAAVAVAC
jgi:hypothetical protein